MEHEEISLDNKPSNRQHAGRYGSKTNKSIKYNPGAAYERRQDPETITEIVPGPMRLHNAHPNDPLYVPPELQAERSVGVGLNAHKNWEWVDNQVAHQEGHNNLRQSQDDFGVDYSTRVAVFVKDKPRISSNEKQKTYNKLYGSSAQTPKEEEIEYVSGENRKGFYVKERRRKGKKGVKRDTLSPNNNTKRPRSRSDAGYESSSSESESSKEERIFIVEKKTRKLDFTQCPNRPRCTCSMCVGWSKNVETKRRVEVKKMDIDSL